VGKQFLRSGRVAYRVRRRSVAYLTGQDVPWIALVAVVLPYRLQLALTIAVGLAFGALAVLFWACFVGGLLATGHGEVSLGVRGPGNYNPSHPLPVLGVFAAIAVVLLYAGARTVADPGEAARYYEWAASAEAPLDAPYPQKQDANAVSPGSRTVRIVTALGWAEIAGGIAVFAIGLLAWWLT